LSLSTTSRVRKPRSSCKMRENQRAAHQKRPQRNDAQEDRHELERNSSSAASISDKHITLILNQVEKTGRGLKKERACIEDAARVSVEQAPRPSSTKYVLRKISTVGRGVRKDEREEAFLTVS